MVARNRKAQKQRARRKKKQSAARVQAVRRQRSLVSDRYPLYACRVNRHWRDDGIATVLVAREIAPRRVTMAGFLVDIWAMGLKDAWGRVDIGASEFDDTAADLDARLGTSRLDIETAQHLVYGGIQLAQELGFRLPRKYERWTGVLGAMPDGESPDMSLFLKDGRVLLMCSEHDLRERLVGCTVEEFLDRPDVSFVVGPEEFPLLDEDEDEHEDDFDEAMLDIEQAFLDAVKSWCFANGQAPHRLLPEVIAAMQEITMERAEELEESGDVLTSMSGESVGEIRQRLESFVAMQHDAPMHEVRAAIAQFQGFMASKNSPEELFESLDLPEED